MITLITILFTSCQNSTTNNQYVNIDDTNNNFSESVNDNRVNFTMNTLNSTCDGAYFYQGRDKTDIYNKKILDRCSIVGCKHNEISCLASVWMNRNAVTAFNGGFYYAEDNKLFYEKDDKSELIIKNAYSTKFSEETYKSGDLIYNVILLDDKKLLLVGANYIFTVDTVTKSVGECIEIGEMMFRDMSLSGDIFIANNMNGELFTANIKTGEVKKRKDYIYSVQAYGGKVYYVKNENNKKKLYYSETDFISDNYIADNVTEIFATSDRLCYIKESYKNKLCYASYDNINEEKELFTNTSPDNEVLTLHYFPDAQMAVAECYNYKTNIRNYKIFRNNFKENYDI